VAVGCVTQPRGPRLAWVIAIRPISTASRSAISFPARSGQLCRNPDHDVIDGHWGFGFHVNAKAMALTVEKAKTANVAACTVFRQSHVGRLAAYPMMAMREGMIGLATADSGRSPKPSHRLAAARRGSAPIRFQSRSVGSRSAFLSRYGDVGGRAERSSCRRARRANSHRLDRRQRRTSNHDPAQFRNGGALLPLGGTEGYKGSGLAAMVEVLCGMLTGLGFGSSDRPTQ